MSERSLSQGRERPVTLEQREPKRIKTDITNPDFEGILDIIIPIALHRNSKFSGLFR
jgi:hypothetical protein